MTDYKRGRVVYIHQGGMLDTCICEKCHKQDYPKCISSGCIKLSLSEVDESHTCDITRCASLSLKDQDRVMGVKDD
jgi:hypothetical protein